MTTLIAINTKALECRTCGSTAICISNKAFFWVEDPIVFCSEKCLESDAEKLRTFTEKLTSE